MSNNTVIHKYSALRGDPSGDLLRNGNHLSKTFASIHTHSCVVVVIVALLALSLSGCTTMTTTEQRKAIWEDCPNVIVIDGIWYIIGDQLEEV